MALAASQAYILGAANIPAPSSGNYSFAVHYVYPEDKIAVFGESYMKVRFRGVTYEDQNVVVIDGPFDDPAGDFEKYNYSSGGFWEKIQLAPFYVPNDVTRWGGININYGAGLGELSHGFITGADRSFGFSAPVDYVEYIPGGETDPLFPNSGFNPLIAYQVKKTDHVFLSELYSQGRPDLGGELGIRARTFDTDGNWFYNIDNLIGSTDTAYFLIHQSNSIQRENTQNITAGEEGVDKVLTSTGGVHIRSIPDPIGFKVERRAAPSYLLLDHFEINFSGTTLTNYMFPSSVWMPDSTWRLMAYNRAEKRYDVFSTTVNSEAGGFMGIAWTSEYHAAHMTRLIDGTMCAMAWTYTDSDKKYHLWFKRSGDDGTTWDDPVLIADFDTTIPLGKTFNPTWVILQDYRTGTVVIGDYFSDDMGHSWTLTI